MRLLALHLTPEVALTSLAAAGGALLAGLVWLIRLEGRVNTSDKMMEALRDDVHYIRKRIDQALQ